MRIEEVKVGDILVSGCFGYRVIEVNIDKEIVHVQTAYRLDMRGKIVEEKKNGKHCRVSPVCFARKYFGKAVVL